MNTPYDRLQPYDALPALPIGQDWYEANDLIKDLIKARTALGELKGACMRLPAPELLLNMLMLQEGKDSSAIENIVTTHDELFQSLTLVEERVSPSVKEVINYKKAMEVGLARLNQRPFIDGSMAVAVMQALRQVEDSYRLTPGTRIARGWSQEVVYTPPNPEAIPSLIKNWESYVNGILYTPGMEEDPLVMMAVMHYQFEAIHPFTDGNGRTGRILMILYLIKEGLLPMPALYLSGYIIEHKADYYRALREVTELGNWIGWVRFVLKAVASSSQYTCQFVDEVMQWQSDFLHRLEQIPQRMPIHTLAKLAFEFPYMKVGLLVEKGFGTRPTATSYLQAMEKAGLLESERKGKERYYINRRLMEIITRQDVM